MNYTYILFSVYLLNIFYSNLNKLTTENKKKAYYIFTQKALILAINTIYLLQNNLRKFHNTMLLNNSKDYFEIKKTILNVSVKHL